MLCFFQVQAYVARLSQNLSVIAAVTRHVGSNINWKYADSNGITLQHCKSISGHLYLVYRVVLE